MIVRIINYRAWNHQEQIPYEYTFPNENGTYTIHTPRLIDQSDRIAGKSCIDESCSADDYAWAYWVGLLVDMDITITVNGNKISATISGFDDWRVERKQSWATCTSARVYTGDYDYYSSINGALIHRYHGPSTMCQGDATWPGAGGDVTINTGTINAQEWSQRYEFANMYNAYENNRAYAYVQIFNDLPPDYRPGAIKQGNIYLSHNRNDGEAHVLGGTWKEMRTSQGHTANDNPPSIRKSNIWTDQLKLGKE